MTCLFSAGPAPPMGAEPAATDRPVANLFTVFRLLRAFLALNLAVGVCVCLNSARLNSVPESYLVAGPLWLIASRDFTEFSPWYLGVTAALAGAMSMPVILFRWWTLFLAIAAAAYWLSIGIWVAMILAC